MKCFAPVVPPPYLVSNFTILNLSSLSLPDQGREGRFSTLDPRLMCVPNLSQTRLRQSPLERLAPFPQYRGSSPLPNGKEKNKQFSAFHTVDNLEKAQMEARCLYLRNLIMEICRGGSEPLRSKPHGKARLPLLAGYPNVRSLASVRYAHSMHISMYLYFTTTLSTSTDTAGTVGTLNRMATSIYMDGTTPFPSGGNSLT
ncbi:hypothetical protein QBC33DRAFT_552734 [Phialemonium atrogriseum]|uniref:Uncharacterized protein n=1 Tax=Phialemonium atrogriseum TaxID=1093897 RepID=A0AAJ0BPY4_9PEZI|nr:uncharacterized protein QBC33DRAFT_552734 [Phialemonium atrogriseum]KAK1762070.1 hypothetical protein QBC33DRAFT_552734 [Phialemonium atrogriseum]